MKKLAFLFVALALFFSFAACSSTVPEPVEPEPETDPAKCTHPNRSEATCTEQGKCLDCGTILHVAAGHQWDSATCTSPGQCHVCKEIIIPTLGHDWKSATCTAPRTCSRCFKTEGSSLGGHIYVGGVCTKCNEKDPSYISGSANSNEFLTINQINWDVNSAAGVEVDINFTNKSSKQIAYVYFTLKFYDRMGGPAYCQIKNTNTQRITYVGPVNGGVTKTGSWDPVIYNYATAAVKPVSIEIEYTDGTKQNINCSTGLYWHSSDYYGGNLRD